MLVYLADYPGFGLMSQLPLEGLPPAEALFELTPAVTRHLQRGHRASQFIQNEPPGMVDGVIRLNLPRWDTAWEPRWTVDQFGRRVVKVDKNGKVVKQRKVWDALKGNARPGHFAQRHKAVKEVIDAVVTVATLARLRPCRHLTVQLVWAPGDQRRADDDNLWGLQKVCCDGLARGPRGKRPVPGLQLVPDDTRQYMEKLGPRIDRPPPGQKTGPSGLWLEVQVLG
jgi:hypothetical protein